MEKYKLGNSLDGLEKTLFQEICRCEKVIICAHNRVDFDALASVTAISEIAKSYNVESYIVIDDDEYSMKNNIRTMYMNVKTNYKVINSAHLKDIKGPNDLIILTDVNNIKRTPLKDINDINKIIVIDHHELDDEVTNTKNLFINQEASSTSEILFSVLKRLDIYITSEQAQRLLTGIYQDTNSLFLLKEQSTLVAMTKLFEYGANFQEMQKLFTLDFEEDRIINNLINNTKFYQFKLGIYDYKIAISMNNEEPDTVYTNEHLANAADYLLKYNIDAAFVIGFTDKLELGEGHKDRISIKARSKINEENVIDVGYVMKELNGGGGKNRAAAIVKSNDIYSVKNVIKNIFQPSQTIELKKTENKVLSLKK